MASSPITYDQINRHAMVLGVFSRLKASALGLQQFLRIRPTDPFTEPPNNSSRTVAYDIFDNTYTMAEARAPMVGPSRVAPKPVGQAYAAVMRLYESIPFPWEKVRGARAIGQQVGTLDRNGQAWVARQTRYAAQRMANSVEWMISRMLCPRTEGANSGFGVLLDGERYLLKEYGSGTFNVSFPIPAGNQAHLDILGAGDVINDSWTADGNASIIDQMLTLNKQSEALTGYQVEHCWLNSTTYAAMLDNTQLRNVRGTAQRVFDDMRRTFFETTAENRPIGFTVNFPSMPQFQWHVYDAVSLTDGAVATDPEDRTSSNTTPYIEDNHVLFLPNPQPGEWYGSAGYVEPIRETRDGPIRETSGVTSWSYATNDPPGEELRILLNYIPLLYVPKAVFYADVNP